MPRPINVGRAAAPRRRKRSGGSVAVTGVALVIAGVVFAGILAHKQDTKSAAPATHVAPAPQTHVATLPARAAGFVRSTAAADRRAVAVIRSRYAEQPSTGLAPSVTGAYRQSGRKLATLFLTVYTADPASVLGRELNAGQTTLAVTEVLFDLNVNDFVGFPPGRFAGSLSCGHESPSTRKTVICAWADGSTLGVAFWVAAPSATRAAQQTAQVRAVAER
jgi:hypothetical protein